MCSSSLNVVYLRLCLAFWSLSRFVPEHHMSRATAPNQVQGLYLSSASSSFLNDLVQCCFAPLGHRTLLHLRPEAAELLRNNRKLKKTVLKTQKVKTKLNPQDLFHTVRLETETSSWFSYWELTDWSLLTGALHQLITAGEAHLHLKSTKSQL